MQTTFSQLRHQATQGERGRGNPLHQPSVVRAGDLPGHMPTHLTRRHATRRAQPLAPLDHARRRNTQRRRHLTDALPRRKA